MMLAWAANRLRIAAATFLPPCWLIAAKTNPPPKKRPTKKSECKSVDCYVCISLPALNRHFGFGQRYAVSIRSNKLLGKCLPSRGIFQAIERPRWMDGWLWAWMVAWLDGWMDGAVVLGVERFPQKQVPRWQVKWRTSGRELGSRECQTENWNRERRNENFWFCSSLRNCDRSKMHINKSMP